MTRRDGWEAALWEVLESAREAAFSHDPEQGLDCVRFAARCIEAVTGETVETPPYSSDRAALRLLAGGGLEALVDQALPNRVGVGEAQRGDVVLLPSAEPELPAALGVCVGEHAASVGPQGFVALPMTEATAAWRVGR
jgi:hypothetical protein